jgi:hypothetical protein
MSETVDGTFVTPEGRRKLFVRQRPNETGDDFVTRAAGFMSAMSDGHALDKVLASTPIQWEVVPSNRWIEAVNSSDPRLRLRVTPLSSNDGGSVGHLVVECEDQLVADDWADLREESVFLPRTRHGQIWMWQAALWSLAHEIRGSGVQYEACVERSGIVVERES